MKKYSKVNSIKKYPKIIISGLIILLLTVIIVSNYHTSSNIPIINYIQDIVLNINKLVAIPHIKYNSYKTVLENNKELEISITELKELNNINNIISDIEFVNATVIARNNLDFYNTITIDKGKVDNLKVGLCVVSGEYLIGKVIKVNNHSSIIKLVTTNDKLFNVSVYINNQIHGILSGFDKNSKMLSVSMINSNLKIKKGDIVTTSGLGEVFPSGIKIGVVEEINLKDDGITKEMFIKSYKNYDRISFVSVLLRENNE